MMSPAPSSDHLTGRSALVIDDNAFMRRLVRSLLRQFGFGDIHEAADGAQALRWVAERPFDVIVCDWMMDPMDGYAFVRRLRQHPERSVRDVPVIMLTAVATQSKVLAARDAGVTEYLVKPVSSGKLLERLLSVFGRPRTFVVTDSYVGPDRRRRASDAYDGQRRRLADRLLAIVPEDDDVTTAADGDGPLAARYPGMLRKELGHLRDALPMLEVPGPASLDAWRTVHRIAHDVKGHAPAFGFSVAGAIADSLEQLLRPVIEMPATLIRAGDRRLRATRTHVDALTLVVDQDIAGPSPETEALLQRLARTVERVHREAAG